MEYNFTEEQLEDMKLKLEVFGNPHNLTPKEALENMLDEQERELDRLEDIYIRSTRNVRQGI